MTVVQERSKHMPDGPAGTQVEGASVNGSSPNGKDQAASMPSGSYQEVLKSKELRKALEEATTRKPPLPAKIEEADRAWKNITDRAIAARMADPAIAADRERMIKETLASSAISQATDRLKGIKQVDSDFLKKPRAEKIAEVDKIAKEYWPKGEFLTKFEKQFEGKTSKEIREMKDIKGVGLDRAKATAVDNANREAKKLLENKNLTEAEKKQIKDDLEKTIARDYLILKQKLETRGSQQSKPEAVPRPKDGQGAAPATGAAQRPETSGQLPAIPPAPSAAPSADTSLSSAPVPPAPGSQRPAQPPAERAAERELPLEELLKISPDEMTDQQLRHTSFLALQKVSGEDLIAFRKELEARMLAENLQGKGHEEMQRIRWKKNLEIFKELERKKSAVSEPPAPEPQRPAPVIPPVPEAVIADISKMSDAELRKAENSLLDMIPKDLRGKFYQKALRQIWDDFKKVGKDPKNTTNRELYEMRFGKLKRLYEDWGKDHAAVEKLLSEPVPAPAAPPRVEPPAVPIKLPEPQKPALGGPVPAREVPSVVPAVEAGVTPLTVKIGDKEVVISNDNKYWTRSGDGDLLTYTPIDQDKIPEISIPEGAAAEIALKIGKKVRSYDIVGKEGLTVNPDWNLQEIKVHVNKEKWLKGDPDFKGHEGEWRRIGSDKWLPVGELREPFEPLFSRIGKFLKGRSSQPAPVSPEPDYMRAYQTTASVPEALTSAAPASEKPTPTAPAPAAPSEEISVPAAELPETSKISRFGDIKERARSMKDRLFRGRSGQPTAGSAAPEEVVQPGPSTIGGEVESTVSASEPASAQQPTAESQERQPFLKGKLKNPFKSRSEEPTTPAKKSVERMDQDEIEKERREIAAELPKGAENEIFLKSIKQIRDMTKNQASKYAKDKTGKEIARLNLTNLRKALDEYRASQALTSPATAAGPETPKPSTVRLESSAPANTEPRVVEIGENHIGLELKNKGAEFDLGRMFGATPGPRFNTIYFKTENGDTYRLQKEFDNLKEFGKVTLVNAGESKRKGELTTESFDDENLSAQQLTIGEPLNLIIKEGQAIKAGNITEIVAEQAKRRFGGLGPIAGENTIRKEFNAAITPLPKATESTPAGSPTTESLSGSTSRSETPIPTGKRIEDMSPYEVSEAHNELLNGMPKEKIAELNLQASMRTEKQIDEMSPGISRKLSRSQMDLINLQQIIEEAKKAESQAVTPAPAPTTPVPPAAPEASKPTGRS